MEKYIIIALLWLTLSTAHNLPFDFGSSNLPNAWRQPPHPNVLQIPSKHDVESSVEKPDTISTIPNKQHPQINIRSEIINLLNLGKPIPIELPRPTFTNATANKIQEVTANSIPDTITELPLVSTTIEAITEKLVPITEPEDDLVSLTNVEEETVVAELNATDQNGAEGLVPPEREEYNQKLQSVLANIQKILPALAQLQENMTELLKHSTPTEPEDIEIQVEDPSVYSVSSVYKSPLAPDDTLEKSVPHSTQDFSFPKPTISENLDREYIHSLIKTLYTEGNSFENLTKIVNTMPIESQLTAYEELNSIVLANAKNEGRLDILKMSCLIFGKPRFDQIVNQHLFYSQTIFPLFFEGQSKFALEARTKSDGFKVFFFDRKKRHFGISNEPTADIFTQWTFHPIKDGSCHFVLQSENFVVGVDVAKSEESPLLAKFVLGIAGLEDGKFDYKYQWKIHPIRNKGREHPYILLENRETNLAIEWTEDEEVILNAVDFNKGNQLWNI